MYKKLILSLFFSSSLLADQIDLICSKKVDEEIFSKTWFNWELRSRECQEKGSTSFDCKYVAENKERWEKCKNSEIAFKYKIRIDKKDIESGSGQAENTVEQNCATLKSTSYDFDNTDDGKIILFYFKVTPSFIMFSKYAHLRNPFQVDRKTLIAEHKQKVLTNFTCRIEEVNDGKNLL